MAQLENIMLIVLGILIVCLIASVLLFHPNGNSVGQFGYKCMKGTLGPNGGYCLKVDEAPNKATGVYTNAVECIDVCSRQNHPTGLHANYERHVNSGVCECRETMKNVDEKNGVFNNKAACNATCAY